VVFYVIGMGANGSGGPEPNERVYANTYTLTLTPPAPVVPVKPTFSPSGVLSAAAKVPGLTPGGLVAIYGQNLSQTTSDWSGLDFSSGKLPTKLGDVTVTVDDKPAAVYSVSPTKIEIQAPDDTARGPVRVVVRRGAVASDPVVVNMTSVAASFFTLDGWYITATHADNTPVTLSRPAQPGEIIVFFGTGFGPTIPATPAGRIVSDAHP
jgi:uncharacterized protein (TIGR03437 family)